MSSSSSSKECDRRVSFGGRWRSRPRGLIAYAPLSNETYAAEISCLISQTSPEPKIGRAAPSHQDWFGRPATFTMESHPPPARRGPTTAVRQSRLYQPVSHLILLTTPTYHLPFNNAAKNSLQRLSTDPSQVLVVFLMFGPPSVNRWG